MLRIKPSYHWRKQRNGLIKTANQNEEEIDNRNGEIYLEYHRQQPFPAYVVGSGFRKPRVYDNALEFHVQGFIHTGNVRIVYIEGADLFQVSLYDEEGKETKRINDVYLDNLAEVIDLNVENNRVDGYNAKVMNYLFG